MKHKDAILILCHQNFEQIHALIQYLDKKLFDIYIHVDAKVTNKDWQTLLIDTNVFYTKKRFSIEWGSFGMIEATEELLTTAQKNTPYRYYHLLSGNCLPVLPNQKLYDFFSKKEIQGGSEISLEYIDGTLLPTEKMWSTFSGGLDRFRIYYPSFLIRPGYCHNHYFHRYMKICRKLKIFRKQKNIMKNGPFYGGSQWFSLSHKMAQFIKQYLDFNPSYKNFMRHSFIPDELFFQTLAMKADFPFKMINNARYIDWSPPAVNSPNRLYLKDLSIIKKSQQFAFARKFTFNKSELQEYFQQLDQ